jgi:hypothetical protein
MKKRREIGSARVGQRLAKTQNQIAESKINEKPPKGQMQKQSENHTSEISINFATPPSSIVSEPMGDRKLLPQRGQQRRTVKSQKRR